MADTKVSALTAATSLNSGDSLLLVQSGSSLKVDVATLMQKSPSRLVVLEASEAPVSGALATNKLVSKLAATDAGAAYTLAAGTHGMEKEIVCISAESGASTAVVTVTGASGFSTLTFDTTGDVVKLKNIDSLWYRLAENNGSGSFVTISASGQIASTIADGTAPFVVTSTTPVGNLSIGGNAATATTATNLSGGTVAATTVTASTSILTDSASGGVGYATGAGGTVTQITDRLTGVVINKVCGSIQTDTTSLAAETSAVFTVANSAVAIDDVVVVSQRSGSNGGNTSVNVVATAAGSFDVMVSNNNPDAGAAETGAIIINFAVIKAVTA